MLSELTKRLLGYGYMGLDAEKIRSVYSLIRRKQGYKVEAFTSFGFTDLFPRSEQIYLPSCRFTKQVSYF
jgi:hypothetical protein